MNNVNINSSLNDLEQDGFVEIINIGLSKAADALSMIIKERVLIKCIEVMSPLEVFNEMGNDSIKLVTDLKGDVEGSCYFVISESEADYLTRKTVSANSEPGKFELNELNKGFLLELDNIISAAVITQLADIMKLNVFGDVPRIEPGISQEEMDQMLVKFSPLFFKTQFRTEEATFNPGFYWFLKPSVIADLKGVINNNINSK